MPRYIDADKLIDLATHEGAYGYVDIHDVLNLLTGIDNITLINKQAVLWVISELSFVGFINADDLRDALELLPTYEEPNDKNTKEKKQDDN